MEFINKGFINTKDFHKETNTFKTASMTFYNGKNEDGSYKNGYITLTAFGEMIGMLSSNANTNQLVTVKGDYKENERDGKRYPQWIVREIIGNGQHQPKQDSPFSNGEPMDVSDLDLPF